MFYVSDMGYGGYYWSSTPSSDTSSYLLTIFKPIIYWQNAVRRGCGRSVRCFRNSSPQTLTFSAGDEVLATKEFRWWDPIIQSYVPEAPEIEIV